MPQVHGQSTESIVEQLRSMFPEPEATPRVASLLATFEEDLSRMALNKNVNPLTRATSHTASARLAVKTPVSENHQNLWYTLQRVWLPVIFLSSVGVCKFKCGVIWLCMISS
jgi:hypothetical protein